MKKVIVYIEGGNFAGAISDDRDIELMIVDYDNEEGSGFRQRDFRKVDYDISLICKTALGLESTT